MGEGKVAVRRIRRVAGAGGRVDYEVDVHTQAGQPRHFEFSGNLFAGPVLVFSRTHDGRTHNLVIQHPRQFGEFATEEWVHNFFAEWDEGARGWPPVDRRRRLSDARRTAAPEGCSRPTATG